MKKVIRNEHVAVLISPGCGGGGWSTWNEEFECLFDPDIVAWIEAGKPDLIDGLTVEDFCTRKYGDFYSGGSGSLAIVWVFVGRLFLVRECDGHESIAFADEIEFIKA